MQARLSALKAEVVEFISRPDKGVIRFGYGSDHILSKAIYFRSVRFGSGEPRFSLIFVPLRLSCKNK